MSQQAQREEGLAHEILSKGDLAAEQMKEELERRDISFVTSYDRRCSALFYPLVALWLLPAIAQYSAWAFLSCFARLPRMDFPVVVLVMGAILFIAAISLEAMASYARQRQGGCHDVHETITIIREGPYRLIRHPGYLAELIYFPVLPIALSRRIPFTMLAVVYSVVLVAAIAYLVRAEDSFNIRKWGDQYRQYTKEVPAINFFKGLQKLGEGDGSAAREGRR